MELESTKARLKVLERNSVPQPHQATSEPQQSTTEQQQNQMVGEDNYVKYTQQPNKAEPKAVHFDLNKTGVRRASESRQRPTSQLPSDTRQRLEEMAASGGSVNKAIRKFNSNNNSRIPTKSPDPVQELIANRFNYPNRQNNNSKSVPNRREMPTVPPQQQQQQIQTKREKSLNARNSEDPVITSNNNQNHHHSVPLSSSQQQQQHQVHSTPNNANSYDNVIDRKVRPKPSFWAFWRF